MRKSILTTSKSAIYKQVHFYLEYLFRSTCPHRISTQRYGGVMTTTEWWLTYFLSLREPHTRFEKVFETLLVYESIGTVFQKYFGFCPNRSFAFGPAYFNKKKNKQKIRLHTACPQSTEIRLFATDSSSFRQLFWLYFLVRCFFLLLTIFQIIFFFC